MKTKKLDIVVPLKERNYNEELRYMLRSIAKNLPHRKVFLAGYKPDWVKNVELIESTVPDGLKYSKSLANTKAACLDERVSDDFILFNDDFFVCKPITEINPVHRGSLKHFHSIYAKLNHRYRNYRDGIGRVRGILEIMGIDDKEAVSYELHMPMIFNKQKRLEAYDIQDKWPAGDLALHTNTLYGNLNRIGGVKTKDVKINALNVEPDHDAVFVSSGDKTFKRGLVGRYIREMFPNKCKYEK